MITQLIYISRPFGFDAGTLDDILLAARRNNRRRSVTGALVCRADLYMQLLEGPRRAVTETFGRILRDDRHIEVGLVWCGEAPERQFPAWDMLDDPPRSWMWSREAVHGGAAERATAEEARAVFERIAAEARG